MPNPDGTPTQAELLARLAQINTILASGVSRASVEGKSTDFVDPSELRRQRDELMALLGLKVNVRRTVAGYSGGFY